MKRKYDDFINFTYSKFKDVTEEEKKFEAQLETHRLRLTAIDELTETLESKTVVQALDDKLAEYSSIKNITYIHDFFMPKLEKFSGDIDGLMADNTDVKECVRNFDDSICTKANKVDIKIMVEEFDRKFVNNDKLSSFIEEYDQME